MIGRGVFKVPKREAGSAESVTRRKTRGLGDFRFPRTVFASSTVVDAIAVQEIFSRALFGACGPFNILSSSQVSLSYGAATCQPLDGLFHQ
jgi:hypothetical protein